MAEGRIELTEKELHRLRAIEAVAEGRLKQGQAAEQSGLTTRQVKCPVAAYRREGAGGLASRRVGRPSNRRLKEPAREAIRALCSERYADFGPTFACEKLRELHGIAV